MRWIIEKDTYYHIIITMHEIEMLHQLKLDCAPGIRSINLIIVLQQNFKVIFMLKILMFGICHE